MICEISILIIDINAIKNNLKNILDLSIMLRFKIVACVTKY